MKLFSPVAVLVLASIYAIPSGEVCAQAPPAITAAAAFPMPSMILSYGSGKTLAVQLDSYPDRQDFVPIAVYCDQILQINLRFPASIAGQTIFIGMVEEVGLITTPANSGAVIIGSDGSVSVGFQAPHNPGHYHVAFRFGTRDSRLPFSVLDTSQGVRPSNCPRAD